MRRHWYRFTLLLTPLCLAEAPCGPPSGPYAHVFGSPLCDTARRCCEPLQDPDGIAQCQAADQSMGREQTQATRDFWCRSLILSLGALCPADGGVPLSSGP